MTTKTTSGFTMGPIAIQGGKRTKKYKKNKKTSKKIRKKHTKKNKKTIYYRNT